MNRSSSANRPGNAADAPDDAAAFRAIAEVSGDAAFIIDCASQRFRYLSPAFTQMFGHPGQSLDGRVPGPLLSLFDGLAERVRLFLGGDERQRRTTQDIDIRKPDGTTLPVRIMSVLVDDPAREAPVLAGVVRDQSEQRERAAEQKRFASMLNHEFRTPLSTIDGAIQRLEATCAQADEPTRQRYRKISVAVDRLIAMLDEYLSPDRMAAVGRSRVPNAADPRQLLEGAAAQARAAGREVALALEELPPSLRCDPAGLRLALKVLVDNALAFSPRGSTVEIAGRAASNGIELSVRDHGPGVPEEDRARIFDKSYRGKNAVGVPGNGLGLYMARSVVEVHGGTIESISPLGGGALFIIWLPMNIGNGKVVATGGRSSDNQMNTGRG